MARLGLTSESINYIEDSFAVGSGEQVFDLGKGRLMPATAGDEYAPDGSWQEHADQPLSDAGGDVIVVVDADRPVALRWRGLLLPVTHAVRWHERPVIPWWRSQRRLDLDQALPLVDQERWRLHADVPPPTPPLRGVPTAEQPRKGGARSAGDDEDFRGDSIEDFAESGDLEDFDLEHPGHELAAVIVDVLRAGDDWHVLSAEEP